MQSWMAGSDCKVSTEHLVHKDGILGAVYSLLFLFFSPHLNRWQLSKELKSKPLKYLCFESWVQGCLVDPRGCRLPHSSWGQRHSCLWPTCRCPSAPEKWPLGNGMQMVSASPHGWRAVCVWTVWQAGLEGLNMGSYSCQCWYPEL